MALDTRDKRDSAIHLGLPWRMRFPVPDGSLAAGADRAHLALLYRGIVPTVVTSDPYEWIILPPRTFAATLPPRGSVWTLSIR